MARIIGGKKGKVKKKLRTLMSKLRMSGPIVQKSSIKGKKKVSFNFIPKLIGRKDSKTGLYDKYLKPTITISQPKKRRYTVSKPNRVKKCSPRKPRNLRNTLMNLGLRCYCNRKTCVCSQMKPNNHLGHHHLGHHHLHRRSPMRKSRCQSLRRPVSSHSMEYMDSSMYSTSMGKPDFKRRSSIKHTDDGIMKGLMMIQDNDDISYLPLR